ncbi:hypothetical protein E4U53_004729 [Claviceps sorghi]|nr:hypothetical protein E4U53_004729 [Claviceps sorghi]
MERKKEQRFTLVHELAIAAQTTEYLKAKWTGKEEDFTPALEKTAHYDSDSHTWTMKQPYWRELNVWKYNYATQEDRQAAIDRAIRQYDKLRLSASESEWQLLLPKAERDKGKCLSRLQANIAKGPPQQAAKNKAQKPDDNPGLKDDADSPESDKPRTGGESMSRSNSSTLPVKAKKPSAQEAQAKRLLSNSKSRTSAPKTSPSKSKQSTANKNDKNDRRVLSAAIVENSDSSEGEAPVVKPKTGATKSKDMSTVAKDTSTTAKDTVVVGTRPLVSREPVKKQQTVKRPRDESDSSSSSGTPLSKRIKSKQPIPVPKPRAQTTKTNYRTQSTRVSSSTYRSKNTSNTSPTKSSPLASSPPTNASDLDEQTPPVSTKRKMEMEGKSTSCKRRVVESVPADVLNKAHKFKTFYQKYEALHHEISALDNPPREKLADLLDMRNRLEHMKKDIYKQCSPNRE